MRGRVSAFNDLFVGASNELGGFESGLMARWVGLIRSVAIGGVMTLLVVAGTAIWVPSLRNLKRMEGAEGTDLITLPWPFGTLRQNLAIMSLQARFRGTWKSIFSATTGGTAKHMTYMREAVKMTTKA
jgi:hypothetical protein